MNRQRRILVAADIHTHPCYAGNQQCIMQYVEVLRKLGCDVYFLYIDLYKGNYITQETKSYWGNHMFYYRTPQWQTLSQKIRRRIERCYYIPKIDVYYPKGLTHFVNKLHKEYRFDGLIVNYIWNSKLAECDIPIKTLFTHDVFTDRNQKLGVKDVWYSYPQKEEAKAIMRFSEVLSIQDEESEWFKKIAPDCNVRTVYSSFEFVNQPITASKNILFFSGGGSLNKDGIERFIKDVWPLLIEKDPEIKLLIGGGICGSLKDSILPEGIVLKGRYDNPDDFYALGDICINPVFKGSGLKIKTMEAIAHGKVTIVDPHSAIGLFQSNSVPLYRAETPQDYLDIVFRFITNQCALLEMQQSCDIYMSKLNNYILQQYTEVFVL